MSASTHRRVLATGPTGFIGGGATVDALLEKGGEVHEMTRTDISRDGVRRHRLNLLDLRDREPRGGPPGPLRHPLSYFYDEDISFARLSFLHMLSPKKAPEGTGSIQAEAVEIVHGYLDDVGIEYCGRYGEWDYIWTDEAFRSGERAVDRALTRTPA